jgi:hypothetical protein
MRIFLEKHHLLHNVKFHNLDRNLQHILEMLTSCAGTLWYYELFTIAYITKVTESRRVRWAKHVAGMGEMKAHNI